MRFLALLFPSLLAATIFASESESGTSASGSSSSTSESFSGSASPSASSSTSSPVEEPTPVGEIWSPKWKDSDLSSYSKMCASSTKFSAEIYTLGEMYPTLKTWAPELKIFYYKQHYPGSWGGEDKHGTDRELLKMDYEDVPFAVREWLRRNSKQRHFSVQDDVVFFAPGAIYPLLPLWVDEPEEGGEVGECEGVFDDLENYATKPKDGVVLGRIEHKKTGKTEVEFTVRAFQVKRGAAERDEL